MNRSTHRSLAATARQVAPWLALLPLAAAMGSAYAQSAPAPAERKAEDAATQTVTISATRRLEAIRDVPVSITKISADAGLDLGAKDLTDVLQSVPGVTYNQQRGAAGSGDIVIRGVTTGIAANPLVGIYLDDVPIGGTVGVTGGANAYDQRLLDLSSIEVLKGPQGTLYGASAMGGLLKYNTRVPDAAFLSGLVGGEASKTQKGGNNYTAYGNVNVPLSAGVAGLRAAAFYSKDGGFIDATGAGGGQDVNNGTVTGGRVALGVRPYKGLDIRFAAQTQEAKYEGLGAASYGADGKAVVGDLQRGNLVFGEPSKITNNLVSLNVEADFGWAKALSITGYQTERNERILDLNEVYVRVFPPFVTRVDTSSSTKLDKTTQEFRLVSASGGAIEWLAGLFFADEKSGSNANVVGTSAPGTPPPFTSGFKLADNNGTDAHWKETALYGTAVWNLSKDLALTAGARLSRNSLDYVTRDTGVFSSGQTLLASAKESPDTYLLAARYKVTPTSSLYARAASGYRAGGPNTPSVNLQTGQTVRPAPYKSDSLWSYELGYKADLAGGAGSFDVALFQTDWKDIQVTVFDAGVAYLVNAGKAQIRGIEFGGVLRPLSGLTLRASASLMDPKLVEDSAGLSGKAGERLPLAAKTGASVNARYDFSIGSASSFAALNLGHVGERTASFDASATVPNYKLPAYTTLDFNAGTQLAGMDFGVYVRNVTDERGQVSAYTAIAGVGGPNLISFIRPRTFGVTLSRAF